MFGREQSIARVPMSNTKISIVVPSFRKGFFISVSAVIACLRLRDGPHLFYAMKFQAYVNIR